jgi:hypothetical protein
MSKKNGKEGQPASGMASFGRLSDLADPSALSRFANGAESPVSRDLIITALQALWRERTHALRTAENVAELRHDSAPDAHLFGIDEVTQALRAYGAAPMTFLG